MSKPDQYIVEAKELINVYGLQAFARVLNRTDRGIQYWFADIDPKKPGPKTQKKVHELFTQHKLGNGLTLPQTPQKDEITTNGHKQDYLSGKNLQDFSAAHRRLAETNSELALVIARVLPGNYQDQVLAPRLVDLITEIFSGKKQISVDELTKELRKALARDNRYT